MRREQRKRTRPGSVSDKLSRDLSTLLLCCCEGKGRSHEENDRKRRGIDAKIASPPRVMRILLSTASCAACVSLEQHDRGGDLKALQRGQRHSCLHRKEGDGGEACGKRQKRHGSKDQPMVADATWGTRGRRIKGAARLMKKLGVMGKMRMTVR